MLLIALAACTDASFDAAKAGAATDAGVTPGGSQDIGYAREIIEQGGIPPADAFSAEGLFSEHDLPLDGAPCDVVLCPRGAAAVVDPVDGSGEQVLVQLGFGTVYADVPFERRPLDLVFAVDVSGSMGESIGAVTKMEAVKAGLRTVAEGLGEADRVGIVAFSDSASTLMAPRAMDEAGRTAFRQAVAGMAPTNGTNMEVGLERAYASVGDDEAEGVERRVVLLTDAQPNVGSTSAGSFLGLVHAYADDGVGLTAMGVGLDFGSELVDALSRTRGGNAFYLSDPESIERALGDEFDYAVTPVAYDLDVEIAPGDGLAFAVGYGTPVDAPAGSVTFGATTLFLSSNDGGMGATLTGDVPSGGTVARFHLAFEPADGGGVVADELAVAYAGGDAHHGAGGRADDLGVYKMGVLVDEFLALTAAAAFCEGTLPPAEAGTRVTAAGTKLDGVAGELEDAPLADEAALMAMLRENLDGGRKNCWPADTHAY